MSNEDTCAVCGSTDTKLVDGFYYCAECGTQDTNVRETLVDHTALDGTFMIGVKQRISTIKTKDYAQMSQEWYKWHAYNFIMAGLTDDLVRMGVDPSFRMKVLWIWAKYMKKHQNKDEMRKNHTIITEIKDTEEIREDVPENGGKKSQHESLSQFTIACMLYLALNIDKSNIQRSVLRKCVDDGRLDLRRCYKYIPEEIKVNPVPYKKSTRFKFPHELMTLSDLNIGPVLVPNLENIIDNLLEELCLPNDLKPLVLSLMHFAPISFLSKKAKSKKQIIPDFENVVLSYVCVALKMCFGLDDDYENRVSDVVDKINYEENRLKAYKSDLYSEPSDRLFSFREWCNYIQFRKYLFCKYNLAMATERNLYLDDNVFEQAGDRQKYKATLSDEIAMDIINKMPVSDIADIIPKSEFKFSTKPLTTATEVISRHLRDLDTRRKFSEDFTQYSISYACKELALPMSYEETSENILTGVSTRIKTYNEFIGLNLRINFANKTLVYVRNCENKNWFKTKPPKEEHIVKEEGTSGKDLDNGYDSNIENTPTESNNLMNSEVCEDDDEETQRKSEVFEEEEESKNIFDDDFLDHEETTHNNTIQDVYGDINESKDTVSFVNSNYHDNNAEDSKIDLQHVSNDSGKDSFTTSNELQPVFDPATFDREKIMKALMTSFCAKYKLPLPRKYKNTNPDKKNPLKRPLEERDRELTTETGVSMPKRSKSYENKIERFEKRKQFQELLAACRSNIENDIMCQVSKEVVSCVRNLVQENENNYTSHDQTIENNVDTYNEVNDIAVGDRTDNRSVVCQENDLVRSENESEESDVELTHDPVYKGDPKFDEKTHKVEQLYVKVKGEFEDNDVFELDSDEEINKILNTQTERDLPWTLNNGSDGYGSEDEIPLRELIKSKETESKPYGCLIEKPEKITEFNYWFRHYISDNFKKMHYRTAFNKEVANHFPKSFALVLFECAAVLNCTVYSLYSNITDIETEMLKKDGFKRKRRDYKANNIHVIRSKDKIRQALRRRQRRLEKTGRKDYNDDSTAHLEVSEEE